MAKVKIIEVRGTLEVAGADPTVGHDTIDAKQVVDAANSVLAGLSVAGGTARIVESKLSAGPSSHTGPHQDPLPPHGTASGPTPSLEG